MEKTYNLLSNSDCPYTVQDLNQSAVLNAHFLRRSDKPCSYKVHGFKISPYPVFYDDGLLKSYVWGLSPRNSGRVFFFSKLSLAMDFCKQYKNNHTFNFWNNLYCKIYSFDYVSKLV